MLCRGPFLIEPALAFQDLRPNFLGLTTLRSAVLVYGAGVLIAQVLILRELLVLARGQELNLALGLWVWLLWTGLGALLGGRVRGLSEAVPLRLGILLALLGLLLPTTLLAIRAAPYWLNLPGGQSLPLGTEIVLYLVLLAPFGLISGYFFPRPARPWKTGPTAALPGGSTPWKPWAPPWASPCCNCCFWGALPTWVWGWPLACS